MGIPGYAYEEARAYYLDHLREVLGYGVDGLYVGVPCVLGAGGVERIIEVELNADEQKMFDASVEHVRTLVEQIQL